jgi:hypothetical protein
MYVDWPQCILELPGFQEQVDPVSGQLLFKGPRLRMGVSEGIPSSVLPDHMGHANYCGKQILCLVSTQAAAFTVCSLGPS